jgi:hypothetical protein
MEVFDMTGFRNDIYEDDYVDKEIRENYDLIDKDKELYDIGSTVSKDDAEEIGFTIWEDELDDLVNSLGLDITIDFESIPKDRLRRIYDKYFNSSFTFDDYGNTAIYDPAPQYALENTDDPSKGLFEFGEYLGLKGELGIYYELLPSIDFSRGYWYGKFKRGVAEHNENIANEVCEEIKVYYPSIVKDELSRIVKAVYDNEEKEDVGVVKK